MSHEDSMSRVLDFAKEMNTKGVNKSFAANLKKFEKKFKFHYA
jgi:hypothetical protein